jgi:hypothetical protein
MSGWAAAEPEHRLKPRTGLNPRWCCKLSGRPEEGPASSIAPHLFRRIFFGVKAADGKLPSAYLVRARISRRALPSATPTLIIEKSPIPSAFLSLPDDPATGYRCGLGMISPTPYRDTTIGASPKTGSEPEPVPQLRRTRECQPKMY